MTMMLKYQKKNNKSIKQNNKNTNEKITEPKIKNKLTVKVDEINVINPSKVVDNLTQYNRRSLSRDISPKIRRLPPLRRRSRSPFKIKSMLISP
jgi:hypothetical protein